MKERSLVFFTLLMQSAVGLSLAGALTSTESVWWLALLFAVTGMVSSFFHLKVPIHAWRALSNLKTSWLSREILCASLFTASLIGINLLVMSGIATEIMNIFNWIAVAFGSAIVFCMGSAYRLKTVKFWDSKQTIPSFYLSTLILGLAALLALTQLSFEKTGQILSFIHSLGLLSVLLLANLFFSFEGYRRLTHQNTTPFRQVKMLLTVRIILGLSASLFSVAFIFFWQSATSVLLWPVIVLALFSEFYGRALFYAAQVPYGVYLLNE